MSHFTYIILNCIVVGLVLIAVGGIRKRPFHAWLIVGSILAILTLIFDNVIIDLGIVSYHSSHYLGIVVGSMPIEDFCYPLLAVLILPGLWHRVGQWLGEEKV